MLCLSGFELYSRLVPLSFQASPRTSYHADRASVHTQERGDFGAISKTEASFAASIPKAERHILDRSCAVL